MSRGTTYLINIQKPTQREYALVQYLPISRNPIINTGISNVNGKARQKLPAPAMLSLALPSRATHSEPTAKQYSNSVQTPAKDRNAHGNVRMTLQALRHLHLLILINLRAQLLSLIRADTRLPHHTTTKPKSRAPETTNIFQFVTCK
jgi:hypothetical protein